MKFLFTYKYVGKNVASVNLLHDYYTIIHSISLYPALSDSILHRTVVIGLSLTLGDFILQTKS